MFESLAGLAPADPTTLLILGGVFVSVLAMLLGVRMLVAARTDRVKYRLARAVAGVTAGTAAAPPLHGAPRRPGLGQLALTSLSQLAKPKDKAQLGRLRQRLSHAGLRGEHALIGYLSLKILLCVSNGLLVLWTTAQTPRPFALLALPILAAMAAGYYLPSLWLKRRIARRKTALMRSLPDALDLMVTCVEAGLGLDAALNRVASEIVGSAPLLAAELSEAGREMRAGMLRRDAFRRMAQRTGLDDLSQLAAVIYQTEVFGTSVAQALRVQAQGLRVRRMQRAEERAATVAVKLAFPLILDILPALMCVLMGPAVIRFARVLLPKLMGE